MGLEDLEKKVLAMEEVVKHHHKALKHLTKLDGDDSRPLEKLVRRKARLRLFVWTGFSPDYTSGLAFAIAKDETEAKKLIEKKHGYSPSTWGDLEILPLTKKTSFSVSGGG